MDYLPEVPTGSDSFPPPGPSRRSPSRALRMAGVPLVVLLAAIVYLLDAKGLRPLWLEDVRQDKIASQIKYHSDKSRDYALLLECYEAVFPRLRREKPWLLPEYHYRLAYYSRCAAYEARLVANYSEWARQKNSSYDPVLVLEHVRIALERRSEELQEQFGPDHIAGVNCRSSDSGDVGRR